MPLRTPKESPKGREEKVSLVEAKSLSSKANSSYPAVFYHSGSPGKTAPLSFSGSQRQNGSSRSSDIIASIVLLTGSSAALEASLQARPKHALRAAHFLSRIDQEPFPSAQPTAKESIISLNDKVLLIHINLDIPSITEPYAYRSLCSERIKTFAENRSMAR